MARDDDNKTTISRRQVMETAAIGAAGIAGGFGLGKAGEPTPAAVAVQRMKISGAARKNSQ